MCVPACACRTDTRLPGLVGSCVGAALDAGQAINSAIKVPTVLDSLWQDVDAEQFQAEVRQGLAAPLRAPCTSSSACALHLHPGTTRGTQVSCPGSVGQEVGQRPQLRPHLRACTAPRSPPQQRALATVELSGAVAAKQARAGELREALAALLEQEEQLKRQLQQQVQENVAVQHQVSAWQRVAPRCVRAVRGTPQRTG